MKDAVFGSLFVFNLSWPSPLWTMGGNPMHGPISEACADPWSVSWEWTWKWCSCFKLSLRRTWCQVWWMPVRVLRGTTWWCTFLSSSSFCTSVTLWHVGMGNGETFPHLLVNHPQMYPHPYHSLSCLATLALDHALTSQHSLVQLTVELVYLAFSDKKKNLHFTLSLPPACILLLYGICNFSMIRL